MGDVRWQGLDHEAIHKMINAGPGPSASGPQADFWGTLSTGLADISNRLHEKLGTLQVDWEGTSGEVAQAGMSPLKEWATQAESGSNVMKISYEMQGDYVGQARAEVPEPVKVTTPAPSGWQVAAAVVTAPLSPGPAAAVAAQAADHEAQERAKDEAARKAVEAMNTYQDNSELNAATLGRFEPPPTVTVETPPPAGGVDSRSVDTTGFHGTNSTTGSTTTTTSSFSHTPIVTPTQTPTQPHLPVGTVTGSTGGTPIQGFPTGPGLTTPQQGQPGPGPSPIPKPSPFPPGTGPFPPPGGGGRNPGYGNDYVPGFSNNFGDGGGRNSLNGPGFGEGPGQGGQGGQGQGGRGGPGGQGGFGQNALDSEGRQMGRGGPGGNPMLQEGVGRGGGGMGNMGGGGRGGAGGMGGAGGGRAEGEEDEEHETPSYLLETEDVFGDERMVAPPVIGERPEQ
jgi:hypothetical protein